MSGAHVPTIRTPAMLTLGLAVIAGPLLAAAALLMSAGPASAAPGFAVGTVFIADKANGRVVEVPAGGGAQTTVGTGLSFPTGVAVDTAGNVFIADNANNRVVKVPAGGGAQTTVGSGLSGPYGVAVDAAGDVFIADTGNDRVVKVPAGGGTQSTVGTGLSQPNAVAVDAAGNVFISDALNHRVVKVPAGGGAQTTVGSGLSLPSSVAVYAPAPTFSADTPPATATVGTAYSFTYTATTPAGEPAATFALSSGALPPGLSLDPLNGLLSGTPTTAGTYQFGVQTQNVANASLGPATTITVGKPAQAISFTSTPPAGAVVGGTYQVSASGGGSGNPVTFSIDPASTTGACTISSAGLVTFTGAGSCVVDADQAGDATYAAAPRATQTITVALVAQAISFTSTPPSGAVVGDTYQVSATGGGSGNPVTFSVDAASTAAACTVSGAGLVNFTGAGSCVIDADQAGDVTYAAAPQVSQTVTVSAAAVATPKPPAPAQSAGGPLAFTGTRADDLAVTAVALSLLGIAMLLVGSEGRARRRGSRDPNQLSPGRPVHPGRPTDPSMTDFPFDLVIDLTDPR